MLWVGRRRRRIDLKDRSFHMKSGKNFHLWEKILIREDEKEGAWVERKMPRERKTLKVHFEARKEGEKKKKILSHQSRRWKNFFFILILMIKNLDEVLEWWKGILDFFSQVLEPKLGYSTSFYVCCNTLDNGKVLLKRVNMTEFRGIAGIEWSSSLPRNRWRSKRGWSSASSSSSSHLVGRKDVGENQIYSPDACSIGNLLFP